jgi:hypothetical protein
MQIELTASSETSIEGDSPMPSRREEKERARELLGPGLHLWEPWQVVAAGFGAGVIFTALAAGLIAGLPTILYRVCG